MSEFKTFKGIFQENFRQLTKDASHLFQVDLNLDALWEKYLDSFPDGTNEMFRERREYDCSCCRQFIRNIGNVVVIKDNQVKTIWDFDTNNTTFQPVVNALDTFVKSHVVSDVFVTKFKKIGTDKNFEQLASGKVTEWEHFFLDLDKKFVDVTNRSEGEIRGGFRSTRDVFKGSLDKITEDSVLTVLELISSNSLHRGTEWKSALTEFMRYKVEYDKPPIEERENYIWEKSVNVGEVVGRIKNHSMGTLLLDISEGMDLERAVTKYEKIVAGENYKRSKPIYSQKMLEDFWKIIVSEGYEDALARRFAELGDIKVGDILFVNRDSAKKLSDGLDIFAEMSKGIPLNPKKFSKVTEITIDDFIKNVLPTVREIEVLLENKHANNMVSLIAPENKDSKTMFKWDNNFGWAYTGNITDSSIKERVKSAGGNVEGILRFSIQWNDNKFDGNDLDAHCYEPDGNEIYYSNKKNYRTTGELDIDIIHPEKGKPAVENITWTDRNKMQEGIYRFFVHNFSHRGGKEGFSAEIEFDGQIFSFEYNKELRKSEKVQVAEVTFSKVNGFSIKEKLPSNVSSKEIWNLKTNQFIPVSVMCYSPNYWQDKNVGHKHYFFMLKQCINPENPNGMFNEFLKEDLMKHRKVMEALGSKMAVKDNPNQLSGLGFSSTKRNELTVKVKGNTERMLKIKF